MPLVILNLDERFLKGGSVESVDNLSPLFVDNLGEGKRSLTYKVIHNDCG